MVFDKIKKLNYPYPMIEEYHFVGTYYYFLEARQDAPEEYHIIANAANKFWELMDD